MALKQLSLLALLFTVGCSEEDTDEGPKGMDPAGDEDGDGLQNGDEEELGTDPNNADSDDDGFGDADEVLEGTNPNYEYSHSYTGEYNVGWCDTPPEPTGPTLEGEYVDEAGNSLATWALQNGDVPDNFTMLDQHGEMVDLYSFCGTQIMVVVSAGWCGPCRAEAETLQALAEEHPDLQILQMLFQNNSGETPDLDFIQGWADDYGFVNVAALSTNEAPAESAEEYFSLQSSIWDIDGYIPTVYHLDTDMTIISADEGLTEPPSL